ncbi:MAG: hypothetical protein MZV65_45310 [Chromatiales bacterium]|nr:hypothetical protein [Chromatiales bacterium]
MAAGGGPGAERPGTGRDQDRLRRRARGAHREQHRQAASGGRREIRQGQAGGAQEGRGSSTASSRPSRRRR